MFEGETLEEFIEISPRIPVMKAFGGLKEANRANRANRKRYKKGGKPYDFPPF